MRLRFLFWVFFFFFSAASVQAEEDACGWILSTTSGHRGATIEAARELRNVLEGTGAQVSLYESRDLLVYLIRIHGKEIDLGQVREKVLSLNEESGELGEDVLTPGNLERMKKVCIEGACLFGATVLLAGGVFTSGPDVLFDESLLKPEKFLEKGAFTAGVMGTALLGTEFLIRVSNWSESLRREVRGSWRDGFSVQKLIARVKKKIRRVRKDRFKKKGVSLIYLVDQEGIGLNPFGVTLLKERTLDHHLLGMGFKILYRE